nr:MAG TPA: tail protein [Bacteriophage sp.]
MVRKPIFKLEANGKDITQTIKQNLISLGFDDKEGFKSDEISFKVRGLFAKPVFGDKLELWLGWAGEGAEGSDLMWLCGKFAVQTCERDFKEQSTEVRATAVDFASEIKTKKRRSWENTTLFAIAGKIADENALRLKTSGEDMTIRSRLQDGVSDLEFLYSLAKELSYLAATKNNTLILAPKKSGDDEADEAETESGLPQIELNLTDLASLNITEANRNAYGSVTCEWQDIASGKRKQIKVGKGKQTYKMQIPEPKSDAEAYKLTQSKLNELKKGGINGRCSCIGANIVAGAQVKFKGAPGLEDVKFSVKSVSHTLESSAYNIEIEFEG